MPDLITHVCGTKKSSVNDMGMREMQSRSYDARNWQYLLIKAPPASGKSRALMYIALDKLANQGVKKIIVAVPERSIGSSFKTTDLRSTGFFANWEVKESNNLTLAGGGRKTAALKEFLQNDEKILICTHSTLRFAFKDLQADPFVDCLVAIDEFHHASADAASNLGELVRDLIKNTRTHIIAMTGSYFRGDNLPVLRTEDEDKFQKVTYTYYEQLAAYEYLKTLGIGYRFYNGSYLTEIQNVIDINQKTIIHIPSVNSRESSKEKTVEVDTILDHLSGYDASKCTRNPETGFTDVTLPSGRIFKVADLVDDSPYREKVMESLRKVKNPEDLDMIIALGMAKEGFDWVWCDHVLTVGYRNSMTEVIQIIGRATRDAKGKTHAQFTNLVSQPLDDPKVITESVNNMLKAISVSLIMEQVLAPNFNFQTHLTESKQKDDINLSVPIVVRGLQAPTTERVREITQNQLDDIKVKIFQDPHAQASIASPEAYTPGEINTVYIPRVIEQMFPDLDDAEKEQVREAVLLDLNFKNAVTINNPESLTLFDMTKPIIETKREGENVLIKLGKKFVNLDDLSIDLIDSINPLAHGSSILAKNLNEKILKLIHGSIIANRLPMDEKEAVQLWPHLQEFVRTKGREPNLNAQDPREQRLAHAHVIGKTAMRARKP